MGSVGRRDVPRAGGTQSKGGHFSTECPPHGVGFIPQQLSPGCGGRRGHAPSPALGAARALPPLSPSRRSRAGILSGGRCQGSVPHHSRRVGSPLILSQRSTARCRLFRLPFSQERESCFPVQRKPGGVMARPAAVAPCPHRGRRGGEARPGGCPPPQLRTKAAASRSTPGRGCGAHPAAGCTPPVSWYRWVCGDTRLGYTHACVGTHGNPTPPQGGIPTGVSLPTGTRLRCGAGRHTRVRAHTRVSTRGGRANARDNRRTRTQAPHPPSANSPTALPAPGPLGPGRAPPLQLLSTNSPARSLPFPTPRN